MSLSAPAAAPSAAPQMSASRSRPERVRLRRSGLPMIREYHAARASSSRMRRGVLTAASSWESMGTSGLRHPWSGSRESATCASGRLGPEVRPARPSNTGRSSSSRC